MQTQAAMGYVPTYQPTNIAAPYSQPIYAGHSQPAGHRVCPTQPVYQPQPTLQQSKLRTIVITVPQGVYGGSIVQFNDPSNGQLRKVVVPSGLMPGMKFELTIDQPLEVKYKPPTQHIVYRHELPKSGVSSKAAISGCLGFLAVFVIIAVSLSTVTYGR